MLLCSAGIPWLINQYKQYVLMRERLLNDTQKLRTKLQKAIPEPNSSGKYAPFVHCSFFLHHCTVSAVLMHSRYIASNIAVDATQTWTQLFCLPAVRNIRSFQDRMNANSSGSTSGKDAAARIHSALEYKRNSAAAPDGNPFSSTKPSAEALSASAAGLGMRNRDEQGAKQTAGSDQDEFAESDGLSEKLARLSPSAPPRVASAMSAAMQVSALCVCLPYPNACIMCNPLFLLARVLPYITLHPCAVEPLRPNYQVAISRHLTVYWPCSIASSRQKRLPLQHVLQQQRP